MDETPGGWQSYADYLGLNEASLRELEANAEKERNAANDTAQGALGKSYQEAQANLEAGGSGTLTGTASYGDFLKAQREAAQANAVRGAGYEAAARGSMMSAPASFTDRRNEMQGRLDQRRVDIGTGKANVDRWNKDRKTERDAQDKAYGAAWEKWNKKNTDDMHDNQREIGRADEDAARGAQRDVEGGYESDEAVERRQAAARAAGNYYRERQAAALRNQNNFKRPGST